MWRVLRDRRLWFALGAVAIGLGLMRVTAAPRPMVSWPEVALDEALAPAQRAVRRVVAFWEQERRSAFDVLQLRRENRELRKELERLSLLESQREELAQQNRRLRDLLGFREDLAALLPYQAVGAEVIGRNPDNWFDVIVVDKGREDGIDLDHVAVTGQGLVGRVIQVTPRTATVMLLTDPESGVGGQVQREASREAGVVLGQRGRPEELLLQFFSRDANVLPGDRIVTSGLGELFPKGLPIGVVIEVEAQEFGLVKAARLAPSVDFRHLEEVLLLRVDKGAA